MTDRLELLADASRRAQRYLAEVDDRPAAPDDAALDALDGFDEPLPYGPTDPAETIAMLDTLGAPATVASTGGRYFGFVNGGTLPTALAASWLVSAWDQNAALPVMSPTAAKLRGVVGGWLVDLLGLPGGTETAFVTGATVANASCLAAARDHQLAAAGGMPRAAVYSAPPRSPW